MDIEQGKYITLGNSISVKQNKNKTYTYFYAFKQNNKSKRIKLFTKDKHNNKNIKEAILYINENIKNIKEENPNKSKSMTLNDLSKLYFESRRKKMIGALKRKYGKNEAELLEMRNTKNKLSGLKSEISRYNKNISKNQVSKISLIQITRNDFKIFLDEDLNIKGLSEKSVHNMISLCKTIINFGIRNDYINIQNPLNLFQLKDPKRKRLRYLTLKELELLLKKCKEYETNLSVYLSVYLGVLTGARSRTILNIKVKDINFENNTIMLDNFKSSKTYIIKITQKASNWLKKQVETQKLKPDNYIVYNTKTKQQYSKIPHKVYEIMDELFNKDIDKSQNLERDNVVNFHTLRRSIATNMAIEENMSIYQIMTFLNHSNEKQTQDYLSLSGINMGKEIESFHSKIFENM